MSWSVPRSWIYNELVTSTIMNAHVRDNLAYLSAGLGIIQLPIGGALLPISSMNPMAITQVESSAAAPKVNSRIAAADASTDEWLQWEFVVPRFYTSGPILWVYYYSAAATSGDALFAAHVACISDGDTGIAAKAYDSVNLSAATTIPGSADTLDKIAITLTNADSMAANDLCNIGLFRDVSGDGVAGDLIIKNVFFVYTLG